VKAAQPPPSTDAAALLARAERLVERLRPHADQVEVYLESGAQLEVELENGAIASTGFSRSSGGAVRVVQGGRLGFAYFTQDTQAGAALEQALRQSRHATVHGYSLPAPPKPGVLPGRFDPDVAALQVPDVLALARDLLQGAAEAAPQATLAGGGAGLSVAACAIASSLGVAAADEATSVSGGASLVLADGERSLSASESQSSHRLGLDGRAVAAKAAATVLSLRNPKPAGDGRRCSLLLHPEAGAELVASLLVSAATGDDALRGKTVWSGKLGQEVAEANMSVVDDPYAPGAVGAAPFDDEGVPCRALPIVDHGVLRSYLFDSWDAHRHRQSTTASAVRDDFKVRPGTDTHHLVVSAAGARPWDALVASIDDGFVVESVLGAHTANVTTGDFSVTAPNVWHVRKGSLEGPVSEIAVAGNLPSLLRRVAGAGSEAKRMSGMQMPPLLFADVDVST
jgi:PmbA protein